ncbi:hypothetical protein K450DRAFT_234984 [Umbelopsis ramanniana AG]|uniref:Uncharacterized protein n=1 Tax=Umbelopsis ramanniana AG TaxID=1314678 RepID=A0AAD5ECN8_UMBRA|nr:uncharacterized protein K450DRAFT_234984 [Umbelopsis ramanniana AG]KAI8580872.1 hypothetical protein K450DRAFT_234984 [Umbelopsis ramanniana AG]
MATNYDEKVEHDTSLTEDVRDEYKQTIPEVQSVASEFVEEYQFTWRASIVGSLLGCVIAASNTYLGLKIGWTFGASLFGAIFSFAILKPLSRTLPPKWGGGYFGPKENCSAQSAATTAGGLSAGFVAGIPAMYKLGLMTTPEQDAGTLVVWTLCAAFYGLFFAVPLRQHFVVNQDLVFPTPRATANTIISLHNSADGEKQAMAKAKWMGIWFATSFLWALIAYWVPFFDTIHILWWIGHDANYAPLMSADADWGWSFTWDMPFFGAGLMTPGSTVWAFFVGQLLPFGIIGPALVQRGYLVGGYGFKAAGPTAQSFFLWPGIALMVFATLTEVLVRYKSLWRGFQQAGVEIKKIYYKVTKKTPKNTSENIVEDNQYAAEELVPMTWWVGGTLASSIMTCAVMGKLFGMAVYQSILAIVLAFILSFVGLQASGETDINPTGAVGKITQLIFAPIPAGSLYQLQKNNLSAGNISASAAAQAVDMVGDLKTGQLVGASPRSQFYAQLVASFFAVGISVGLFILFAKAWPCIIDTDPNVKCEFGLVAVNAWKNVTLLLTGGEGIPRESAIITGVCAAIGIIFPAVKFFFVPEKYHRFWPSVSAVGVGFINTAPEVPIAMVAGWTAGKIWKRIRATDYDNFMYAAAGGLVAGQGIAAILKAVLTIGGVEQWATAVSCIDQDASNCP